MEKPQEYFNNKPQRKKGYDYDLPGAYFVTICLKKRRNLFGKVINEICELSGIGKIADKCWKEIPEHFKNVGIGEYIIMPNHFHGIVLMYDNNTVGQTHALAFRQVKRELTIDKKNIEHIRKMHKKLSVVVGSYKSAVTKESNRALPGSKFAWQTSFYDHIVRDDKGLEYISDYIRMNPLNWNKDLENEKYLSEISEDERAKQVKEHYSRILKPQAKGMPLTCETRNKQPLCQVSYKKGDYNDFPVYFSGVYVYDLHGLHGIRGAAER